VPLSTRKWDGGGARRGTPRAGARFLFSGGRLGLSGGVGVNRNLHSAFPAQMIAAGPADVDCSGLIGCRLRILIFVGRAGRCIHVAAMNWAGRRRRAIRRRRIRAAGRF